jgi:imidazolonepropionase-like amidohydrolase
MATYFAGVTLFDGHRVRERAGVLTSGGTIDWVGAHRRAPREARAAVEVDGAGATLTPGLIDSHVHLTFDGSADFAAEGAGLTEGKAALKAVRNLRRNLERGVTTVRDLGGIAVCDVAAAIGQRIVWPAPRVIASGLALTITGGHGRGAFAEEVDGPSGLRMAIRRRMRAGARSIKLIATGGVLTPGTDVWFTAFSPDELAAAVGEAHGWGRPVAAHAIGGVGIDQAVRAGVDSIEHGSQISTEAAHLMAERGTFHVPTICALRGILDHPDQVADYALAKALQIVDQARDSFRHAARAGVRHACGTDAGTPFNVHGNAPVEIARMVEFGMTPVRALQSATVNAAELLRVPEAGAVEEGKSADLVLYRGNPLEDVSLLLEPAMVMRAGEIAVGAI